MKVQVLGKGCPKCRKLEANTQKAIEELGIEAELEHIHDINEITRFGVMLTPALVIDGTVKTVGEVTPTDKIKKLLQEAKQG